MRKWKKFTVYQIKKDAPNREDKIFKPYEWVKERFGTINMNDYRCVFSGEELVNGLDDIFTKCNSYPKPTGYTGWSMSISDIIEMDGKKYYCDAFGWKEM